MYNPSHPLVCTCGNRVDSCPFWQRVQDELGRPLASLELRAEFAKPEREHSLSSAIERIPKRMMRIAPGLFRYRLVQRAMTGRKLPADIIELFDAVFRATRLPLCVDSSKSPFRFRAVYDVDPSRSLAIVLTRDFRAVVRSKIEHGQTLEMAATGWRKKYEQIAALMQGVSPSNVLFVRYEELCESPHDELNRICKFLRVDFAEAMLQRSNYDVHHIGGSPSKFDESKARISLDRSFEKHFDSATVEKLRKLIGPVALRLGY